MPPTASSAAVPAAGGIPGRAAPPRPPLLAARGAKQGAISSGLLDEHDSDVARAGYLQHFLDIRQRIDLLFSPRGGACLSSQLRDDIRDLRPRPTHPQPLAAVRAPRTTRSASTWPTAPCARWGLG